MRGKESVLSAKSQVNIKYNYLLDHEHPNDGHSVLIKSSGPINVAIITHGKNEKKNESKSHSHHIRNSYF